MMEVTLAVGADGLQAGAVDMDVRQRLSYALDRLATASGGRADTVLSYMALDGALRRLSANLVSAYRLRYASVPDLKKRKLELSVARPGTKVLIPQLALRDESKKR